MQANQTVYCLALLKLSGFNIIGRKISLRLSENDIFRYTVDNSTALSPSYTSSHTKEVTKTGSNAAQAPATNPSSYSPHSKTMSSLSPVLLMLSLALLW
ncbi:hypothetical protein BHE74_00029458 [Ensete ventricosum]|nr:hypothetical protein GW17_00000279 [Ensete ventricosum]RWW63372.1 hypothetical protein BHE74_00029458 [Ensete ventricosum]RZS08637.1 hypothetical protein BHM03_00039636 [Ensete ventricosum]